MSNHSLSTFTAEITAALRKAGKDFGAHSVFSPSGSAMWAYCSGSLVPNLFKPDSASEDAAYGTVGHELAEQWLKTGEKPSHRIGEVVSISEGERLFEVEITDEMMSFVEEYVDWCIYLPGVHFVETRVDFSDLTPLKKQSGTADHCACEIGHMTITDLKMGKGVQVFAKDNTQAVLYAYGFFKKYDELFDFQTITIRIGQPRLGHFDVWEITRAELLRWAAWLKERAYAAWCEDATRTPGEKQCRWCKIKQDCAAHAVLIDRLVDGAFDDLESPITSDDMTAVQSKLSDGTFGFDPIRSNKLTLDQKTKLIVYRPMIESWFSEIYADLESRCLRGETVPGYKVVEGRSNRVFTNAESAADTLEFLGLPDDVIRPRGMITPAQAEAALLKVGYRKKQLPDLLHSVVRKPPGKPSMVPDSDSRPAIKLASDTAFDNLDETL